MLISSWSSFFLVICKIYKQFIYTAEKGLLKTEKTEKIDDGGNFF